MEKKWEPVELLRHTRHDWLNHIQVIKANLSLNRIERAQQVIEEITAQSQNESKLTNLHISRVAEMLLTFNWQEHRYRLQVEVLGKERSLAADEKEIFSLLSHVLELLDQNADWGAENLVMIFFHLEEKEVFLTVDFSGGLQDAEQLKQMSFSHKRFTVDEHYANEQEFVLTLKMSTG